MSRITHDNIDKWLFNLEEGNLSASEKRELDQFLDSHPELKEEADAWKLSHISEPLTSYAYEAELHAITAGAGIGYRKYAAMAGLLLLLGGSALYLFFNSETIQFSFPDVNTATTNSTQNDYSNTDKTDGAEGDVNTNSTMNGIDNSTDENGSTNSNSKNLNVLIAGISNTVNGIQNKNNSNQVNNNVSNNANNVNLANNNVKNRNQVSIDIKNNVKVIVERETQFITETNDKKKGFGEFDKEDLCWEENMLPIVENVNINPIRTITDDKSNNAYKPICEDCKSGLDPDPALINLRDHTLLMTNNNIIDNYGGFAGGMISSRFSMNYRNNWTGKNGLNSQSAIFTYDKLLRKLKTGVALTAFYNDYNNGMFTSGGAALTISPKFKVGRGITFEPAATFSYAQKAVDRHTAVPGTFIEDRRGNVVEIYRNGETARFNSAYTPDVKLSAVFQHKKFWAAASVDHLLMPKEPLYTTENNMYRNGPQFKATVGTDYIHKPESGNVFSPQFSLYVHDGYAEYWMGSMARFRQFSIGGSFSQFKDFIATAGFRTNAFQINYQFDMTRSMLMNEKMASHEISMRFALNAGNRKDKSILEY